MTRADLRADDDTIRVGVDLHRPTGRLVAAVALANKTARIAWAVMSRQSSYRTAAAAI